MGYNWDMSFLSDISIGLKLLKESIPIVNKIKAHYAKKHQRELINIRIFINSNKEAYVDFIRESGKDPKNMKTSKAFFKRYAGHPDYYWFGVYPKD
jgi:hypothetical protein